MRFLGKLKWVGALALLTGTSLAYADANDPISTYPIATIQVSELEPNITSLSIRAVRQRSGHISNEPAYAAIAEFKRGFKASVIEKCTVVSESAKSCSSAATVHMDGYTISVGSRGFYIQVPKRVGELIGSIEEEALTLELPDGFKEVITSEVDSDILKIKCHDKCIVKVSYPDEANQYSYGAFQSVRKRIEFKRLYSGLMSVSSYLKSKKIRGSLSETEIDYIDDRLKKACSLDYGKLFREKHAFRCFENKFVLDDETIPLEESVFRNLPLEYNLEEDSDSALVLDTIFGNSKPIGVVLKHKGITLERDVHGTYKVSIRWNLL